MTGSPQLLSKLFPQTAVVDQAELQAEQEKRKKEEEGWLKRNFPGFSLTKLELFLAEEKKEQDKQWKRMKLGFYLFGVGGAGFGLYTIYELGQPEKDAEGRDIEDEFSHLPTFEQYKRRILASFNYYQKFVQEVREILLTYDFIYIFDIFSLHTTSCFPIHCSHLIISRNTHLS